MISEYRRRKASSPEDCDRNVLREKVLTRAMRATGSNPTFNESELLPADDGQEVEAAFSGFPVSPPLRSEEFLFCPWDRSILGSV